MIPFRSASRRVCLLAAVAAALVDTASAPGAAPTTASSTKLALTTWAAQGWLKNPVALSFDRDGRCYVAQTQRRENGEMHVKKDANLVLPDATFMTVDDRSRFGGKGEVSWGDQTGGAQETITLLQDTQGSGHADKGDVFYKGFDRNINDILGGVLWHDSAVYATIAPDLWMLKDGHGTGHAEHVRSLSHGYGVHMSYSGHNMHGLTVGPDGKLYFTIGDKGMNVATGDGRKLNYANTGACLRCNPDGTKLEVFAYGLRNLQEFAFDKYGNLIGVDNDGDYPTERERFVYVAEGSDTGWRFNWQYRSKKFDVEHDAAHRAERYNPWINEKMWVPYFAGQPSHIVPALANYSDGPCGFKYATEACLDPEHAGYFFVTQFPKATINAFVIKPKGASFTMANEHIVSKGTQVTGLAFGPDGALYGCDWGKSAFKLGNVGAVVKLDNAQAAASELRKSTQKLLKAGAAGRSIAELAKLLDHADMRVRLDAQFELVKRKEIAPLRAAALNQKAPQMGRIHGLWGIGEFVDAKSLDPAAAKTLAEQLLAGLSAEADVEVSAQTIKLLGEFVRVYGPVIPDAALLSMTASPNRRVAYFAAMALRHFHDPKAVPALFQMLADNTPMDTYIRHAAVMGLAGSGDIAALRAAAKHPSPLVRLGAIVALRRLADPGVAVFLNDPEEVVIVEAARAIHDDDSIPEALPALAKVADRPRLTSEALLRRALNANLRLGGAEQIQRLVRYAATDRNPPAMRTEAINMLADWEHPPIQDRVEGWYRVWPKRSAEEVKPVITAELAGLLAAKNAGVARAAAELIGQLKLTTDDTVFAGWVADSGKQVSSRVAALSLLASRKYPKLTESIDLALASHESALRSEAVSILAAIDEDRALAEIDKILAGGPIEERQAAYGILGAMQTQKSCSVLNKAMDQMLAGKLAAEVELDLLEASTAAKDKNIKAKVAKYEASLSTTDPLAAYKVSLVGGNAERGREIFNGHPEAACIRCHSIDSNGGSSVGPNLQGIGSKPDKTRAYILQSMIDPSAYIVPGFGIESITLKNGTDVSGFGKSETATTIELVDLEGKAISVKKTEIETRAPAVSMMPAMGVILNRTEIRDVIEYVCSLKN